MCILGTASSIPLARGASQNALFNHFMKAKINTQIKFYHHTNRTDEDFRGNANAVSKALVHLDHPWVIETTSKDEFVAYCTTTLDEAIVLPKLPSVEHTRFLHADVTVDVLYPIIMSSRVR